MDTKKLEVGDIPIQRTFKKDIEHYNQNISHYTNCFYTFGNPKGLTVEVHRWRLIEDIDFDYNWCVVCGKIRIPEIKYVKLYCAFKSSNTFFSYNTVSMREFKKGSLMITAGQCPSI